jgi:hypothetical protein
MTERRFQITHVRCPMKILDWSLANFVSSPN